MRAHHEIHTVESELTGTYRHISAHTGTYRNLQELTGVANRLAYGYGYHTTLLEK